MNVMARSLGNAREENHRVANFIGMETSIE